MNHLSMSNTQPPLILSDSDSFIKEGDPETRLTQQIQQRSINIVFLLSHNLAMNFNQVI